MAELFAVLRQCSLLVASVGAQVATTSASAAAEDRPFHRTSGLLASAVSSAPGKCRSGPGSGETGSAAFEMDADGKWTRVHDSYGSSTTQAHAPFDSPRWQTQAPRDELLFAELSSDGSEAGS